MANLIERRDFMQKASLGLVSCLLIPHGRLLANPYGLPIGLQLMTVDDHLKTDFEGTLQKVAEIGYREVELGRLDYYGKRPGELRRILSDHGLKAVSRHFSESQLKSDPNKQIADAKECGITYVGLASLEQKSRQSLDAVKRDAEWFNQVGEAAVREGCTFFYHGHNFDYATVDGAVIYDELIRGTDPKLVNFELDCFWCVFAGKDPVAYFRRFPGRFPQLHIKDLKPGYPPTPKGFRAEAFTEVGQGVIDWKKIFKASREGGLKHYYVEQDHCDGDSLESARISYRYLHSLTV